MLSLLLDAIVHIDQPWYNVRTSQGQWVGLTGGWVPQYVRESKVAGYSLAFSLQPCNCQCLLFFLYYLLSRSLIFYK